MVIFRYIVTSILKMLNKRNVDILGYFKIAIFAIATMFFRACSRNVFIFLIVSTERTELVWLWVVS